MRYPSADEFQKLLLERVLEAKKTSNKGAPAWSAVYHGGYFTSLACSLTVAALTPLHLKDPPWITMSFLLAALSALAAFLTDVATYSGAERKWKANRLRRQSLADLLLDLQNPAADTMKLREEFRAFMARHDTLIAGDAHPSGAVSA